MREITIFSIPKPFIGHVDLIQRNAIQSWLELTPRCEVILYGNDQGVGSAANEFGVRHIPAIDCNEYGTPLISSAFEHAQDAATYKTLCYVNADVIFLSDLMTSVQRIDMPSYLVVGQRWNLGITTIIDYQTKKWEEYLREDVSDRGELHPPLGSDYFVFPKGSLIQMPEFAVGRPGWDNWMIYQARARNIPVIDATEGITLIHQDHEYSHIPEGTSRHWHGPEADINRVLGEEGKSYGIFDATHLIGNNGLQLALKDNYLKRRINRLNSSSANIKARDYSISKQRRARLLNAIYFRRKHLPDFLWRPFIYQLTH